MDSSANRLGEISFLEHLDLRPRLTWDGLQRPGHRIWGGSHDHAICPNTDSSTADSSLEEDSEVDIETIDDNSSPGRSLNRFRVDSGDLVQEEPMNLVVSKDDEAREARIAREAREQLLYRPIHDAKLYGGTYKTLNPGRELPYVIRRRIRTSFNKSQVHLLEQMYTVSKYISKRDRAVLAKTLGLTNKHIKIWFQNRRCKDRKSGIAVRTRRKGDPKLESCFMAH